MTNEERDRAIEFLISNQTKNTADIGMMRESIDRLTEDISKLTGEVGNLTGEVENLTGEVGNLTSVVTDLKDIQHQMLVQAESDRQEIREAINNLIVANEVTRDLAQNAARLAIATNHRVTLLEGREGR
ncbi:MAG TPA: hypothetical protein VFV34_05955 [Blastocatellia bacterium]|nr:hypothetical protein [Blastocatellia bacterium]